MTRFPAAFLLTVCLLLAAHACLARTKLVTLPERSRVVIGLDNPAATLIEEERTLALQQGLNRVDFSWEGVRIDSDSIVLTLLSHADSVRLLSVSYPPGETSLTWDIASPEPLEVEACISYLLEGLDRLVTYKAVADTAETRLDLKTFLVLRNFSGEDFQEAGVRLQGDRELAQDLAHEETRQLLFGRIPEASLEKVWTFDAAELPWDPERTAGNVGIPVSYRLVNDTASGLGSGMLFSGKVRVFQEDGQGSTILLGEDFIPLVPPGEEALVRIGDSRDIVVTQRKMQQRMINIRRNTKDQVVLHDTDEIIEAQVENFKGTPATLTMIQHIPGQWDMQEASMEYERLDAFRLKFKIDLEAHGKRTLVMHYHRRNVRQ